MISKEILKLEDECLESILITFIGKTLHAQQAKPYSVANIEGAIRLAFLRGINVGKNWKKYAKN